MTNSRDDYDLMVAMLIENHNQNGVLECRSDGVRNRENPLSMGQSERVAESASQVQGPKFKVQSWGKEAGEEAEFEDLRLKMRFWIKEHAKAWTPNREGSPLCVGGCVGAA